MSDANQEKQYNDIEMIIHHVGTMATRVSDATQPNIGEQNNPAPRPEPIQIPTRIEDDTAEAYQSEEDYNSELSTPDAPHVQDDSDSDSDDKYSHVNNLIVERELQNTSELVGR